MKINISQEDFGTLCICAIRYCHGRQTYMPSLVQTICKKYLKEFSDKVIAVMLDDCKFQEEMELYGDPYIDKPDWIRWKEALIKESERRKKHEID